MIVAQRSEIFNIYVDELHEINSRSKKEGETFQKQATSYHCSEKYNSVNLNFVLNILQINVIFT